MDTTKKDRIVRWTILIGGALFILAMTYGSGMRAQVKKIQRKDEQRKVAEQNYRDAQRKLLVRLAGLQQLEARRQVALALAELDHRNFGNVKSHIGTAVGLLQKAQAANTASPDLQNALNALQQVRPEPSVNTGADRDTLQAIADQMDTVLSGYVPDFLRTAEEDDTAHPILAPTMNDVPMPPGNQIRD